VKKVKENRKIMPKIGGRKLLYLLQKDGINIGRDKLFNILQHENLLVKKRRRKVITTNSKHWLKKYPDLTIGMEVTRANKLWVADITYVVTDCGFAYLFLITDAYSRKIVGYCLSQSLEAEGGLEALRMALSNVSWQERIGLIHHSDRGVQYCCHEYVNILNAGKMLISMTNNGDPYENPKAERVNGILKVEWIYSEHYKNYSHAKERISEIILVYNSARPHLSCDMLTPEEAHLQTGVLKKHWKKRSPKIKEGFYEA
jgi:transposase InsO family protein